MLYIIKDILHDISISNYTKWCINNIYLITNTYIYIYIYIYTNIKYMYIYIYIYDIYNTYTYQKESKNSYIFMSLPTAFTWSLSLVETATQL